MHLQNEEKRSTITAPAATAATSAFCRRPPPCRILGAVLGFPHLNRPRAPPSWPPPLAPPSARSTFPCLVRRLSSSRRGAPMASDPVAVVVRWATRRAGCRPAACRLPDASEDSRGVREACGDPAGGGRLDIDSAYSELPLSPCVDLQAAVSAGACSPACSPPLRGRALEEPPKLPRTNPLRGGGFGVARREEARRGPSGRRVTGFPLSLLAPASQKATTATVRLAATAGGEKASTAQRNPLAGGRER
jgi:hypothetical protein